MSNKQVSEVTFSHHKPIPWRIIDPGLCLEGRCLARNGRCNAYQQMLIGNLKIGQFTISRLHTFQCPMCGSDVRAEKFGLNRCQWRIMNTNKWSYIDNIYQTYELSRSSINIEIRNLNKTNDSNENCTICLNSMDKKSKCSILPCKHLFHMECINEWIDAEEETSLQCPVCRRPIFE